MPAIDINEKITKIFHRKSNPLTLRDTLPESVEIWKRRGMFGKELHLICRTGINSDWNIVRHTKGGWGNYLIWELQGEGGAMSKFSLRISVCASSFLTVY